MIKIKFLGATKTVTGSCFVIECDSGNYMIDCGMLQGKDEKLFPNLPYDPSKISAVLLTHAHIDHCGRLPLLVKNGYKGKIHATQATCELCNIMLVDSAYIQMRDAETESRKNARLNKPPVEALYDIDDAEATIPLFVGHSYNQIFKLNDSVEVCFTDAGHLLGSSSINIYITENNETKCFLFSGDIGNINQPIIKDPQNVHCAEYVIMESTYGSREHTNILPTINEIANIIDRTFARGGNLIIPSFAVGRSQELLYFIREIQEKGLVKSHPNFKIYLDSPLAVEATKIFTEFNKGYYDENASKVINEGKELFNFKNLSFIKETEDSKMLNELKEPKIIISSSGMCEAGRIRHHLKHNLWKKEATILFVGYQAIGTLGRMLLDGAKSVKLFGEKVNVNAEVISIEGLSGHADCNGLHEWVRKLPNKAKRIFLVHGEEDSINGLTASLNQLFGYECLVPDYGDEYDIATDKLEHTINLRLKKTGKKNEQSTKMSYNELQNYIEKLTTISSTLPKAVKRRMERELEKLIEKYS